MGLLSSIGLGTDAPELRVVQLDPGTQGLINAGVERAGRPSNAFANEINSSVSDNSGSLGQGDQRAKQQSQQQGGQDQNMFSALRQSYAGQAGAAIGRIKSKNEHAAVLQKADYTNKMAQMLMAQGRAETQTNSMLTQIYNQSEAARAQFVNSIFQTATTVGAMYMGNRKPGKAPGGGENVGGYSSPEVGSAAAARQGAYNLDVSNSGAGGYGNFPGSQGGGSKFNSGADLDYGYGSGGS